MSGAVGCRFVAAVIGEFECLYDMRGSVVNNGKRCLSLLEILRNTVYMHLDPNITRCDQVYLVLPSFEKIWNYLLISMVNILIFVVNKKISIF